MDVGIGKEDSEVAEEAVANEEVDLFDSATVDGVLESVDGFETEHDVVISENLDDFRHDSCFEDLLGLSIIADKKVTDCPDDFLADGTTRMSDQEVEDGGGARREDELILLLSTTSEVADDAHSRELEKPVGVGEESNNLGDDT